MMMMTAVMTAEAKRMGIGLNRDLGHLFADPNQSGPRDDS